MGLTMEDDDDEDAEARTGDDATTTAGGGTDHRSQFESELDQSQRSHLRKRNNKKKKDASSMGKGDGLGGPQTVKSRRKRLDPALQVKRLILAGQTYLPNTRN